MNPSTIFKKYEWYHGDKGRRETFEGQNMDRDRTISSLNEYGPGIYFTNNLKTAATYGNYIYQLTALSSYFHFVPNRKPTLSDLLSVYNEANDDYKESFLSNFGIEDMERPQEALRNYLNSSSLYDALEFLYGDLFMYNTDEYIAALVANSWHGHMIHIENQYISDLYYLIVWAPDKFYFKDVTEEVILDDFDDDLSTKLVKANIAIGCNKINVAKNILKTI